MRDFAGATAVVTGAAGGIGRALALGCARRGMRVVACDLDAGPLGAVAAACRDAGAPSVEVHAFDVRDPAALAAVAAGLERRGEGARLLFANAGVLLPRRLWEHTEREFQWLLGVNVEGVVHALRAFVPAMLARADRSHVVITGSMGGFLPSPMLGAYSASKAAVAALAETLCYDLAAVGANVGVSLLAPGAVRTGLFDSERHAASGSEPLGGAAAAMRDALTSGTARAGLDPDAVAEAAFAAIEADRFWVFPHPAMLAALPDRTAAIMAGENPRFDFRKAFRR